MCRVCHNQLFTLHHNSQWCLIECEQTNELLIPNSYHINTLQSHDTYSSLLTRANKSIWISIWTRSDLGTKSKITLSKCRAMAMAMRDDRRERNLRSSSGKGRSLDNDNSLLHQTNLLHRHHHHLPNEATLGPNLLHSVNYSDRNHLNPNPRSRNQQSSRLAYL